MDNPISTIEHLPKNQKLMVIGGAGGLGLILVYRSHQKNLAAAQANDQGGQNTDTGSTGDGTAQDGTGGTGTDPTAQDPYSSGDGMVPYGTDPYSDLYDGGLGYSQAGLADPALAGAGDFMFPTATAQPPSGTINVHVTGGGAPHSDANKHHAGSSKKRHGAPGRGVSSSGHRKTSHGDHHAGDHETTHHKTAGRGKTAKSGRHKKHR